MVPMEITKVVVRVAIHSLSTMGIELIRRCAKDLINSKYVFMFI